MANLWSSRAGAMNDEAESQVVGMVDMVAAPAAVAGGPPATTRWWDGVTIASNIDDETAEWAFRVAMEGLDSEAIEGNHEAAIWLIEGYQPGDLAAGAMASAEAGAPAYPASTAMGLMHTALGENVADFLTGSEPAEQTLADIEAAYLTAARERGLVD
jgi:hypothetical protein